jgi:hypothetical protein
VTNQGKDVTKGIQPRFVYQSTFPNYYELVEDWEVEENTNINVLEEIEEIENMQRHRRMCWVKYHKHAHIKGI